MAIDSDAARQIQAALTATASMMERIASLRKAYPALAITRCDASDMDAETAWFETSEINVYLMDTSEHCVRITNAPQNATGLIVAVK